MPLRKSSVKVPQNLKMEPISPTLPILKPSNDPPVYNS